MTMGRLAGHLAEMPGWASFTVDLESLDVAHTEMRRVEWPEQPAIRV